MEINRLTDLRGNVLVAGNILRVPGQVPYEDVVDFMIFETLDTEKPLGLIVTTGYKAGSIYRIFDAKHLDSSKMGISVNYLIDCWQDIYLYCDVAEALIGGGYDPPQLPIDLC